MGTHLAGDLVHRERRHLLELKALTGAHVLLGHANHELDTVELVNFAGTGIAVNPTTGHVFVANSARNTLTVIDGPSLSVLATVPVGSDPGMVGVNPATNRVYISNRGDNTVQAINDTFTRRLPWWRPVSGNR